MSGVLVTGARGFAGRHLVEHLEQAGAEVTRLGTRSTSTCSTEKPWRARSPSCGRASCITAPARRTSASPSATSPIRSPQTCSARTTCSTGCGRRASLRRVLITGSSLVYRQSDRALKEEDPIGPATPYALSKLAQEMLGRRGIKEDGQQVLLTPLVQPHGAAPEAHIRRARLRAADRADREGPHAARRLSSATSTPSRDLHDVRDTVRAYAAIVERGRTRQDLQRLLGPDVQDPRRPRSVDRDEPRAGDGHASIPAATGRTTTLSCWGDRSRIERELGWKPEIPLDQRFATCLTTGERR